MCKIHARYICKIQSVWYTPSCIGCHNFLNPSLPTKARLAAAETTDAKFCTERLINGWCFCCFVLLLMCAAASPKHTSRIAANNLHSHVKSLWLMPLQQYLFAHLCMTSLTLVTLQWSLHASFLLFPFPFAVFLNSLPADKTIQAHAMDATTSLYVVECLPQVSEGHYWLHGRALRRNERHCCCQGKAIKLRPMVT